MKPEKKQVELSEEEKIVFDLLKAQSPAELVELKGKTGLSNKKWDTAIKGLTKNKLAKVTKDENGLTIQLLG